MLPTGFACALKRIPTGPLGQAMHAISLLVARQLVADIERFRDQVELYVVPPLCPVESHSYDYTACGGLIDRAAQQTRDWIARGGLKLSEVPHELREHSH